VSGGVQGTLACGKNKLSDLIFVPIARTPEGSTGILAALDKKTGKAVWEFQSAMYSWSSPVLVYDKDGNGYVIYCTSGGYMYLLDGRTGETLDARDMGGNIEASAAAFGNTIVVGTRSQTIWGVTLS
jgi:outer membrane protein assembly factor BamB